MHDGCCPPGRRHGSASCSTTRSEHDGQRARGADQRGQPPLRQPSRNAGGHRGPASTAVSMPRRPSGALPRRLSTKPRVLRRRGAAQGRLPAVRRVPACRYAQWKAGGRITGPGQSPNGDAQPTRRSRAPRVRILNTFRTPW
jgi:hypothetical protein